MSSRPGCRHISPSGSEPRHTAARSHRRFMRGSNIGIAAQVALGALWVALGWWPSFAISVIAVAVLLAIRVRARRRWRWHVAYMRWLDDLTEWRHQALQSDADPYVIDRIATQALLEGWQG